MHIISRLRQYSGPWARTERKRARPCYKLYWQLTLDWPIHVCEKVSVPTACLLQTGYHIWVDEESLSHGRLSLVSNFSLQFSSLNHAKNVSAILQWNGYKYFGPNSLWKRWLTYCPTVPFWSPLKLPVNILNRSLPFTWFICTDSRRFKMWVEI